MKKSLLSVFILCCAAIGAAAWAGTLDSPTPQSAQPQQTFTVCGPSIQEQEQQRLAHDAEMVRDMEARDRELRADHQRYNEHLKAWLAQAGQWAHRNDPRVPDQVIVGPSGVTSVYNNK